MPRIFRQLSIAPSFNYQLYDRLNPAGANDLDPLAMYYQRLLYKEQVYPSHLFAPLDTWYDKLYYGRVDQQQNSIIPDAQSLLPIASTARNNLFALNFVVEAFEDFVAHMRSARILGILRADGNDKIFDMKAYRAYRDPTALYGAHLDNVFEAFLSKLLPDQSNKITNFATFIEHYGQYLQTVAPYIPITKSNYMLTNIMSVMNSGLAIAIDQGPPGDDAYKYDNFINDPNFNFYVRAAKKFGFTVNKNIPWILTADLFSDPCLQYLSRYANEDGDIISKDNFFEAYFKKTYLTDIQDLRNFMINSYNTMVERQPLYQVRIELPNCGSYSIENLERVPNTRASVAATLTEKVSSDFYLALRGIESQNSVRVGTKLKAELGNIYHLQPDKSISRLQNVAEYINQVYRDYIYEVDYIFLNRDILRNLLDNTAATGKLTTVGSIVQRTY